MSLKRKISLKRHIDVSEEEIIRSRLIYEGDQGNEDRRISTLMKSFHQSWNFEKLFSILHAIEHSYRMIQVTLEMNRNEQICYRNKSESIKKDIKLLKNELEHSEQRLMQAKRRRLNLFEYDRYTDRINQFQTRKALIQQKRSILERKRYFEHLQQTFETTYQQRLKQIAVYLRSIFEFDEILQQDNHEDNVNESSIEQIPSTSDRLRTYSDSSIGSFDGEEFLRSKQSLISNQLQPYFSTDLELYGVQLVHPFKAD